MMDVSQIKRGVRIQNDHWPEIVYVIDTVAGTKDRDEVTLRFEGPGGAHTVHREIETVRKHFHIHP